MDGSHFDSLTRTLFSARSRRSLARLFGSLAASGVLSAFGIKPASAGTRLGGDVCTKDTQCATNKCIPSIGKCSCSKTVGCKQPANRCKQATCNLNTKRCVTSNKPKGADCSDGVVCTANDACDGEGHCIGEPRNSRCKSDDPCQRGLCRPKDSERNANGCIFEPITTGECGSACTSNGDCCPPDRPGCTSETGFVFKTCVNGDCVCNRSDYPHECTFPPNPSQCHQCCNNDDCIARFEDPNRTCLNGNCVCGGDKPTLCRQRVEGGKTYCTDTKSDPENCSPFVGDCGVKCAPDFNCVNGQCVFGG